MTRFTAVTMRGCKTRQPSRRGERQNKNRSPAGGEQKLQQKLLRFGYRKTDQYSFPRHEGRDFSLERR